MPSSTRRRRIASAVALVSCAAALALASGAGAAGLPPGAASYGLVAFNANLVPGDTLAARTASYRRLYDAGVRAVRLDVPWAQMEPLSRPPGDYDFSATDRELEAISAAGLEAIGIIDYSNPRYSTRGAYVNQTPLAPGIPPFAVASAQYFPPDNPADFATYARAVASHYRARGVIAWEIWNEENEGWRFWPPHEDPAAYANLLCDAHDAVKAVDPATPVLLGGLFFPAVAGLPGTSATDFVAQSYAAHPGLGRCSDAVAYHPYAYTFTAPELDVPVRGSVLAAADQMHAALARVGDGQKPLWITEVGWPTNSSAYGVSEAKQAQYVARMEAATFAQGTPVLTWYTYGDAADPTGANQESAFGFFRADGSPKPSYTALGTFARTFAGAHFTRDRSRELGLPAGGPVTGGRGFALEYERPDADVTALWYANESVAEAQGPLPSGGTLNPPSVHVSLPVAGTSADVVDYLGSRRTVQASAERVALDIGPGPLYVIVHRAARPARPQRGRGAASLRLVCAARGLRATVSSRLRLRRVEWLVGGRRVATRTHPPFSAVVRARGRAVVIARVVLAGGVRATVRRRALACPKRARFTG